MTSTVVTSTIRQRKDTIPYTTSQATATSTPIISKETSNIAKVVWSSGVPFYPPSDKYWRIGGKWYDFTDFKDRHPGGGRILEMARDRFEDVTFVFESHHHNYAKARAIIRKFEVPEEQVMKTLRARPTRQHVGISDYTHFDVGLESKRHPRLLGDDAFYSVIRKRVAAHLKSIGYPSGGPTTQCIIMFWAVFAMWCLLAYNTWRSGSLLSAVIWGFTASFLGAFGHNWVHQPHYQSRGWAILSLDVIGFSSEGWFREHNLQHHMYTNTPWDNHFRGMEPYIKNDPTMERTFFQAHIAPLLCPVILSFGLWGNYIAHLTDLFRGREELSIGKFLLPIEMAIMVYTWGWYGLALMYTCHGVVSIYYFSLALMNHNAEHCTDVSARNSCRDWGEAQLQSSADWGVNLSFTQAWIYLWLNYHTVHHLFPRVDFSHHPAIQQILIDTCREFDVNYVTSGPMTIYAQMIRSFRTPSSLMKEIIVYAGSI